ncbi:DUF7504 family protein [Haloarcula pellucida]|uniref:DICT domain-containing protein n=1 Tax=Haloarcula pellucida TaxID=1427151 RepID=A0A830GHG9_9EURY|nr:DICT sensory domain-containing protein [Halomicroarcula pellucida]MBX0347099.1 hypothetical protein [Halomicroarcula pellucida]GGN86988.1 hypothetical protein GCM10009030_05200 [Halomicroarcula pellucida]
MYALGDDLPVEGLEPGSTLLVVGPPMTGKRSLVIRLLADGFDHGEAVAVLSTDTSAADVRASLSDAAGRPANTLPVGVVDCVSDSHGASGLASLDGRVGSPADLTGIGMELTQVLEALYTEYSTRIRFGLFSLTTMSLYASPEQVVRFLHVVTNRISEADGVGFVVAHSDTMGPEHLQRLRSFVDGVVEVREADGGTELRVLGVESQPTPWTPFDRTDGSPDPSDRSQRVDSTDRPLPDSLRSVLDSVRADSPTLTVCNYEGPPDALEAVERYFDRHGITVREASLDVAQPRSVALLHHGDDVLGSESVTALAAAIDIQTDGDDAFSDRRTSELLRNLDRSVFGAAAADKNLLVDVSHTIELLANRVGRGRLHAGFQYLSRLTGDPESARIYERLADSGLDVHVYGVDDTDASLPGVTVHSGEASELSESWFVVFDGDGDPSQRAALLAVERDGGGQYEGVWTYDSDFVRRTDAYLTETYGDSSAGRERQPAID